VSTDRDIDRIVRSWMDEGVTQLPDRVLDAVLDQLPANPQRRTFGLARRFPNVYNAIRIGVVAAAAAVILFAGARFLALDGFGGPGPIPTAIPTPSPRPLPAVETALEPGTYLAGGEFLVPVYVTVPAGWVGRIGGPYLAYVAWTEKPGGVYFSIFDKVAVDPCQSDSGYVDLPPQGSVEDLVTALTSMPGIEVTGVSDVSIGGSSGTQLTMKAPESFASCSLSSDGYVVWQLPLGATNSMVPGEVDRLWILDVAGQRLVIQSEEPPGYTAEQRADVQAVLNSIQIEPGT
jgi:hypothetical protein